MTLFIPEQDNDGMTSSMRQLNELNKHIIGQDDAKRALIRLTNCADMRIAMEGEIREAVRPFHAIFYGPTGSGKSALVECHAKTRSRPYIKTEATRYTEVGYVGRDVESMIRDLVDVAVQMVRDTKRKKCIDRATSEARSKVVDALVGNSASAETRHIFMNKIDNHDIDDREIEIEVRDTPGINMPMDMLGGGHKIGIMNLGDLFGKTMGKKNTKTIVATVKEALEILIEEAVSDILDEEKIAREALKLAESSGIIFIDEIDKIANRYEFRGGDVNREGVQRDLLPVLDGAVVQTRYGQIRTHHILFIAAGAFHNTKLSDLLPELQGRFPIRVKLSALSYEDFVRILRDTQYSLPKQYIAMLASKNVTLNFTDDGVGAIAKMAVNMNRQENTGARRLRTVLDKVLHDITFDPERYQGQSIDIDGKFVDKGMHGMRNEMDLSKFVL